MRWGWILALLLLAACEPASGATDASAPESDAGPPAFELRLERSMGVSLEDGDDLEAEYGCQGGAHVMFDVVAIGDGLDGAQVSATALGRDPITLTMSASATGAEYRHLMLVIAELAPARSLGLPREETVRVSVRRRDGARVVIDRRVRLIDGEVCTLSCDYADVPGTARVTAVDGPDTTGCEAGDVTVTYDFTPDAGDAPDVGVVGSHLLPPDCLAAMDVAVGADLPAMRRDLLPGSGTCSPFEHELLLDHDACAAACPGP